VEDTLATIENVSCGSGDDAITGNGAANVLKGGGGNDAILAGGGDDIIIGEAGDDVMNGGAGNDTFVFNQGFGHDVITGFGDAANNQDTLDFSEAIFKDFGAVFTATHQVGNDVHIDADGLQSIILTNVMMRNLGADDFRFHA
jgi:serralysin